jgi:hypothetical protein
MNNLYEVVAWESKNKTSRTVIFDGDSGLEIFISELEPFFLEHLNPPHHFKIAISKQVSTGPRGRVVFEWVREIRKKLVLVPCTEHTKERLAYETVLEIEP